MAYKYLFNNGRIALAWMCNLDFWYIIPTIEIASVPTLRFNLYIRFLCFALDFIIFKKKGR